MRNELGDNTISNSNYEIDRLNSASVPRLDYNCSVGLTYPYY